MKKYKDTVRTKTKRLIWAVIGQLIRLIPLALAGWYISEKLLGWLEAYFEVSAAQQAARLWSVRAAELSEPVIWNPSTIAAYLKALFMNASATSKAYTLASVAGVLAGIGSLILKVLGVLAILYAFIRIKRVYRAKTQAQDMTAGVYRELMPELEKMQVQIDRLEQQIARLNKLISESQSVKTENQK